MKVVYTYLFANITLDDHLQLNKDLLPFQSNPQL
jgi:hypothetical protein